jgi:hypothetical protein
VVVPVKPAQHPSGMHEQSMLVYRGASVAQGAQDGGKQVLCRHSLVDPGGECPKEIERRPYLLKGFA